MLTVLGLDVRCRRRIVVHSFCVSFSSFPCIAIQFTYIYNTLSYYFMWYTYIQKNEKCILHTTKVRVCVSICGWFELSSSPITPHHKKMNSNAMFFLCFIALYCSRVGWYIKKCVPSIKINFTKK